MDCEQALILISAALDGETTPEERQQLNKHLDLCAECRALAADFGLISAALSREEPVPAGLTGRMERELDSVVREKKKVPFLRRYGSVAAMLALVVSLGAIVLSGGGGKTMDDAAVYKVEIAAPAASAEADYNTGSASMASEYELVTDAVMDAADSVWEEDAKAAENSPLAPPESEHQEFDPPDHATIYTALRLVLEELRSQDGFSAPTEEDYSYCVLERTETDGQTDELRLEYTGLSTNGKYYTFCLAQRTVTEEDPPAEGAAYTTLFNNFAVSRELDEVLREYDENRTAEHLKAYRAALSD